MNPHDNTKLFQLLEEYIKDNKYENYVKVASELSNGNAYLVLPSAHDNNEKLHAWHPAPEGQKIKLGIYYVDGLKATAAFTSKDALYTWAKKPTECVSLSSKTVIEICEANDIDRIVVDSGLRTMVILQRNDK
jgi:hypothetical protein